MINALMMHPNDDVAVVTAGIPKGSCVKYATGDREVPVTAADDIPLYHKIAVRSIRKGDNVLKYGEVIGRATADIAMGSHVHIHNLTDVVPKAGEEP